MEFLCQQDCCLSSGEVPSEGSPLCVAVQRATSKLESVFGFHQFRPGQLEAILPPLHGRDVFVQLATGGGKSLAMFLVPLAHSETATGIIISPLNG